MREDYPGQAFYHEHNPRIRAAELAHYATMPHNVTYFEPNVREHGLHREEVEELFNQFCLNCGAGKGAFRREGEGTCRKCDPEGCKRNVQIQTSGPKCKMCGAFTTYARVESHGLCMKCELERREYER